MPKKLFEKGKSGNPAGRPKGSRNKLTEKFFDTLAADFEKNGKAAIEAARIDNPVAYLQTIARVMPKELKVDGTINLKSASVQRLEQFVAQAVEHRENPTLKDVTPDRPVLPAKVRAKSS